MRQLRQTKARVDRNKTPKESGSEHGSTGHPSPQLMPPQSTVRQSSTRDQARVEETLEETRTRLRHELEVVQGRVRQVTERKDEVEALLADKQAKEKVWHDSSALDKLEKKAVGKTERTKAAKKQKDEADKRYKNLKKIFDGRSRDNIALKEAQAQFEDFFYYQNAETRWQRSRYVEEETRREAEAENFRRGAPYMIWQEDFDDKGWIHELLNRYDKHGVGESSYRLGHTDWNGGGIDHESQRPVRPRVGPTELHLWTPPMRRQPAGLRPHIKASREERELEIELDLEAIEKRRLEIEQEPHERDDADVFSHQERRQKELQLYDGQVLRRPSTANVRTRHDGDESFTVDHFRKIRTTNGLFIAAKESPWDWLTSYDCLGNVKPGEIPKVFPTSNVRVDDDWVADRGSDDPVNDLPTNVDNGAVAPQSVSPDAPSNVPKKAPKKAGKKKPGDQARGANIDYPYPKNEFSKPPQAPRTFDRNLVVDEWAEETTGRREWHHYGMMSPSSEVDSPPHLPIPSVAMKTVPDGFALNAKEYPQLEPRGQRCRHNTEGCRNWWNDKHLAKDCWVAYPEKPTRPDDPLMWPISEIDEPKSNVNNYVPTDGRDIYKSRVRDHYGLTHNIRSDQEEIRWPRIGIRVPYEPMTFDDLRLKELVKRELSEEEPTVRPMTRKITGQKRSADHISGNTSGGIIAEDAEKRTAYEVRSMAVPIMTHPTELGSDVHEDVSTGSTGADLPDLSDDEDDPFTKAYKEGSRAAAPAEISVDSEPEPQPRTPATHDAL
ncbi:hypothetical protein N0V83_004315 [Neocucurbitaria cava]|uniref:Uncharacterized protein n=1 Tax=Neocucurbitaria cava TaxID=798079 RepID=A0A9W9CM26_9PLEO|nr:hypothetical protein N0V83_004315 [Neocucurbitaria cava]